jgi:hypothetical protein
MSECADHHTRTIRVILIRHGEREDESEEYDRHLHTRKERVDPALTIPGYRQALHAWQHVLKLMPNQRAVIVTSPLRRCLGTAAMAAAAMSTLKSSEITFRLPATDLGPSDGNNIPIVIMNGLCDYAKQIQHMGGAGNVVENGWIDCAASPTNDLEESLLYPTLLQQSLSRITQTSHRVASETEHYNKGEICTLQFWRERNYEFQKPLTAKDVAPLTASDTLLGHAQSITSVTSADKKQPCLFASNAPANEENCEKTLERAVLLSARAGMETCIAVTHRETIRFIEKKWCFDQLSKYDQRQKLRTTGMYCCLGIYSVTVHLDTCKMEWASKAVIPYKMLNASHMEI